jgi:hypothetical protein
MSSIEYAAENLTLKIDADAPIGRLSTPSTSSARPEASSPFCAPIRFR